MKKLVFILAIAVFTLQSCNSSQAKENSNTNETTIETPTEPVSENDNVKGGSVKLTKEVFLKEVWDYNASPQEWKFKGDKPAMIDFYADWCGPCKTAAPILEEISNEYAGKIIVYKIDTQVERELAGVFGISGIPAFLYIPKDGKPVMMSGIGRSKEATKNMFIENIDKYLLTSN
ncbi:MAG: thiol reductase thioredoxin [Prolixibacteraceae bacterium]|jgi:thioredoxin|nr:thiol reductase thioredoxin [Prolixibacteraceae bacterium]MBT6767285.1 thiol reductase thioredoxin [Prolixibacteraceae bacterium]MBT7000139.1 thiol reductase thioredoxin [Prolixibacteraceae bacterium]MBT7397211.1 thiol reductase thioredoxin [Prolixibacteraceae bacterium]